MLSRRPDVFICQTAVVPELVSRQTKSATPSPFISATPRMLQGNSAPPGVERYHKARAQREEYEAKLAQLEYKGKAGILINAEAAPKHLVDTIVATRNGILNVPRTIAPELVGIQDEVVIIDKLNHALETAKMALSENVF